MKNSPLYILEAKLKQHNISFFYKNKKMKIDNPPIDYPKLIGFAILPILAAIGILIFLILDKTFDTVYGTRLRIFGIFLLGGGLLTLKRVQIKKRANKNVKILEDDAIIIKNKYGVHRFDASNIKDFEYSLNQISEHNYEGNIYLVDQNDRKHLLLSFGTNNQKHVLYDLKWFVEFFIDHTKVDKDDLDRASAITLGIPSARD
jgi:hypothetical protein